MSNTYTWVLQSNPRVSPSPAAFTPFEKTTLALWGVKDLYAEIETLKAEIEALKAKVS